MFTNIISILFTFLFLFIFPINAWGCCQLTSLSMFPIGVKFQWVSLLADYQHLAILQVIFFSKFFQNILQKNGERKMWCNGDTAQVGIMSRAPMKIG